MMLARALGLDPGQGEFLAEDLRQVVEGEFDFKDVLTGGLAGPLPGFAVAGAADRRADVARPLPHAAPVLVAVAELGDLDLGQAGSTRTRRPFCRSSRRA